MGGDGWGGGQHHGMRCAQADRDRCSDVLKAAWAEGRLDDDEYRGRLEKALSAQTYGQLADLVHDLPLGPTPPAAAVRPVQPAPPFPQPFPGPYGYPPHMIARPVPPQSNGLAIASMVVGIVTMVAMWPATAIMAYGDFNPWPFAFGGVAVVTGHVALYQSRTRPYPYNGGAGHAVAGLALGWIQVVLAALIELGR